MRVKSTSFIDSNICSIESSVVFCRSKISMFKVYGHSLMLKKPTPSMHHDTLTFENFARGGMPET